MKDLKEIEKKTQSVYEENALEYDRERGKGLFEKKYLDLFLQNLGSSKEVLDLGCGSGDPIARYLIENECSVTGADYSNSMLKLFQERFPNEKYLFCDMRELQLNEHYDGIISWGAFFHLNMEQQRKALPKLCQHLKTKGLLMITVGHGEGEVTGRVAGEDVYHSSLSQEEYSQILRDHDMKVIAFNLQDPECNGFSVFLAQKC